MSINNDERHRKFLQWLVFICILILLDQVSKAIIRITIIPGSRVPFIDNILFITFIKNYRGFSWFVPILPKWVSILFLIFRFIILLLVFPVYDFCFQTTQSSKWAWISVIAISAGILGNILDDLFLPYTTDFIQIFHSPSANLADLFTYIGLGTLAIELYMQLKKKNLRWRGLHQFLANAFQVRMDFISFVIGCIRKK